MKAPWFFLIIIIWTVLVSIGPIQPATARHCHASNQRCSTPRVRMPRAFIPYNPCSSSRLTPRTQFNPRYFTPKYPEEIHVPLQSGTRGSTYLHELNKHELAQWPLHKRVLNVYVKPGNYVNGYRNSYKSALISAFQEWTKVSNGRLRFRPVATERQADITVKWVSKLNSNRDSHEVGKTYTLTKRYRGSKVGLIEKAHVNFLTHLNGRTMSDLQMRKIALHEIGHAIGIQGHSSDPRDIMFHSTSPYQNASLTTRDINTMKNLYGNQLTAYLY